MPQRYLITGATGFVGGHVAQACAARGFPVRVVARSGSDTALLEQLGALILRGDLTDQGVAHDAIADIDIVVHCAAKVGDSGRVEEYRAANVDALQKLLNACIDRPVSRFICLSSLGVYEARHHHGTDESEPLPAQHLDGYTQSKVEAEQLAMTYYRERQVPVVVLRPGFVYGPRDRTVLPRLIQRMRTSKIHYLGGGERALNTIYIENLVDAVFLAVERPQALGQVYNLTDGEFVSKRRFIEAVADGMGLPHSRQILPGWLAALVVRYLKRRIIKAGQSGQPRLTHAQFKFLLLNLDFSIDKARRELGYAPRFGFDEAIRRTMAWYRENA